jgi:hypothetical protein
MNNSDLNNSDQEEDETIEDDVQKIKFTKKNAIILGIVMVIIFIGLHFKTAHYKDDSFLCFSISPLSDIIFGGSEIDGWVIFEKTIHTEWGTITLKPFCKVSVISNHLSEIDNNNKNADYDLVVFGNKIKPSGIGFDFYGTHINTDEAMYIGSYKFIVDSINFETGYDNEGVYQHRTRMDITNWPESIQLSCGAELSMMNGEDYYSLAFENVQNEVVWRLYSRSFIAANFETCSYKSKNQENSQPFNKVTFEPNWGAFISGEVYDD